MIFGVEIDRDIVNSELEALGASGLSATTGRHTLEGVVPARVMLRCSIAADCLNNSLGVPGYKLIESAGFIRQFDSIEEMRVAVDHPDYQIED